MKQDLWLPWPPTANTMFGLKGHMRFVSSKYKAWKDLALTHLASQRPTKMDGCVAVTIKLTPPTKRQWDIDNRVKPIIDILVTYRLIEDDNASVIKRITVECSYDNRPGANITVEAIA